MYQGKGETSTKVKHQAGPQALAMMHTKVETTITTITYRGETTPSGLLPQPLGPISTSVRVITAIDHRRSSSLSLALASPPTEVGAASTPRGRCTHFRSSSPTRTTGRCRLLRMLYKKTGLQDQVTVSPNCMGQRKLNKLRRQRNLFKMKEQEKKKKPK